MGAFDAVFACTADRVGAFDDSCVRDHHSFCDSVGGESGSASGGGIGAGGAGGGSADSLAGFGRFVGAHLVSVVLYSPGRIVEEPLVLVKFWDGISSFGGIFGGLVVAYLFFRRLKLRMKHYTQALLFGAVVCLMVAGVRHE